MNSVANSLLMILEGVYLIVVNLGSWLTGLSRESVLFVVIRYAIPI